MREDRSLMKLGAFIHPTGAHVAAWLHPGAQVDAVRNFEHYIDIARTVERGKFDLLFIRDSAATRDGNIQALSRWPQYMAYFEPTTLLAALAPVTRNLGLIATATTSYNEPYNIARRFASLDHISGGRAGWNVVTSSDSAEAFNFGRSEHFEHGERYERAREFVDVVCGLWDSYDDDAFLYDRRSARYFRPDSLHRLDHRGKHFSVRGPLNLPRPPQGYPVLAQAGASETGKSFAAQIAEVVFAPLGPVERSRALYLDIKGRLAQFGRHPDDLKVMAGINPIVAPTEDEAQRKWAYLQSQIHPDVGRLLLSEDLGHDISDLPVDEPIPLERIPTDTNGTRSNFNIIVEMAREERLTIRQMYERYAGARGHYTVVGTPSQIADRMEEWFVAEAVDGFLIQPPYLLGGLADFVDMVIPELQYRGLFRREYEGATLRENLGLSRPRGRYAAA